MTIITSPEEPLLRRIPDLPDLPDLYLKHIEDPCLPQSSGKLPYVTSLVPHQI